MLRHWRAWTLVLLLLCRPATLHATEGSIGGTVRDPSGAVIAGVALSARHVTTSAVWTTTTDAHGRFSFLRLPVGIYEIDAQRAGFERVAVSNLVVNIGVRITLPLTLPLTRTTASVVVTSEAPLVEPTRSQISSVVDQGLISNLPVNGRNFTDFVRLVPFVSRVGAVFNVAGQRGQNLVLLDGADDHNTWLGTLLAVPPSPYQVSLDAVQEFQVNVNAYSAEHGRAGSGVVNVVTRSGTNDPHGSVFWFYRDKALTAVDPVRDEKDPLHVNQFGGSMGGAIRRNSLFFFGNYEGQRRTEGNPTTLNLPAGFSLSANPQVAAYQQLALNYLQPRAASWVKTYDQNVLFSRVDWQIAPARRLTGRWNRHRFTGANLEGDGLQTSLEHTGASEISDDALAVTHTTTVASTIVNVFRASYLAVDQPGASNSINPEAQIFEGGQNVLSIGRLPVTPRLPSSRRAEWADTVSFVTGRHTVETGANLLTDWITFSTAQNFSGSYRFNSLESFGRSLAGVPAPVSGERYIQAFSGEGTHGVRVHPDFVNVAAFVQDEWRARSNLTLNLGIRYDAEVFARPDVKNPSPVLAAAGIDTSVIPADWNNVAPRLGIAWMPRATPPVVIRAGYGIFYGRTAAGHAARPFFQNGLTVQTRTFSAGTPGAALIPAYPNTVCGPPDPAGAPPNCPAPVAGTDILQPFSADYEQPRVHQGSAGIDVQWGRDVVVSVSYLAVRGTNLHRYRDINLGTPATPQTIGIAGTGTVLEYHAYTQPRPLIGFDRVLVLESSGRSTYDGLAVQLTRKLSDGFQLMSAYTLGRALDDISNVAPVNAGQGDGQLLADSFDNSQNWGAAPSDRRHIFVVSAIWGTNDARFVPSAARPVLKDWQLSGVITAQSGVTYSGFVRFDLNNDGNTQTDRTPGSSRGAFRMPGGVSADVRLMRSLTLRTPAKLQVLVEAFNLFNSAVVSDVQSVQYQRSTSSAACGAAGTPCLVPVADFGAARNSTGPRTLQLALKIVF